MWADAGIDPNNASMVMQMRPLWHKMLWHQIRGSAFKCHSASVSWSTSKTRIVESLVP